MRKYALMTLNVIEYTGINLEKNIAQYEFWMCLTRCIADKVTVQITDQLSR